MSMEQPIIANGGLQYVPQIAVQYVYLDFDGELTSYNGEILTVDNVEVQDSSLTEERIANIVAELNAKYADKNVIFVTERPQNAEYSTIYIGKTEAFAPYGSFAGLAETIDKGNKISTDKAFVLLDSTASDEQIISTITHETDHLLGPLNHGGEGLNSYADNSDKEVYYNYYYYNETYTGSLDHYLILSRNSINFSSSPNNRTSHTYSHYYASASDVIIGNSGWLHVLGTTAQNIVVNYGGVLYLLKGGAASNVIGNDGAHLIVEGGIINNVNVNSGADLDLRNGIPEKSIGNDITISPGGSLSSRSAQGVGGVGWIQKSSVAKITQMTGGLLTGTATNLNGSGNFRIGNGGVANSTVIHADGVVHVSAGGTANSTTLNSSGSMRISSGGLANDTTINSRGSMYVYSSGSANNTTINSGGSMCFVFGGEANSTTINSGGSMSFTSDGVANDTTINSGGYFNSWRQLGDSAAFITEMECGGLIGTATDLSGKGTLSILSGAVASNTVLSSGMIYVSSGGSALQTVVSLGAMVVSDGGYAYDVTVYKGSLYAGSDANLYDVKIMYGGNQTVSAGAILKNQVTLGGTMKISGTIDTSELESFSFVLEERSGGNSTAMLNDISLLNAVKNYSISVLTTQKNGQYKLAGNAAEFGNDVVLAIKESRPVEEVEPVSGLVQYHVLAADGNTESSGEDSPFYTEFFKLNSETGKYNICAPDRQAYVLSQNDSNELVLTVKDAFVKLYYENELLDAAASMKNVILQENEASRMEVLDKGIATSATAENYTSIDVFNGGTLNHAYIGMDAVLSLKNGAILQGKINVNGIISVDDEYGATVNANDATINVIIPDISLTEEYFENGFIKGLDKLSGTDLSITVIGDSAKGICKIADNAKLFQNNISMTRVYADDSAPEDGIFKWYADLNFYSAVKTRDDYYYIINKSANDELYLTVTEVEDFEVLKDVVPKDVTHYNTKVVIEDFEAGWGKKTNKRSWASLKVTGLTFCAAANTENINISCHGKMEGALGILSVTADLSRDGDGLFLTMTQDSEDNWEYSNWELVGKFDATLQKVDRRFKFDLPGTKILDTKSITGTADINTIKGEYTLSVDWKRSQWGTFQIANIVAEFKECTQINKETLEEEVDLDLSRIEITLQDDPTRVRTDLGMHVYKVDGACGNLAASDKDPAYFSGSIAFTWMSRNYRIKQQWVKDLCEDVGITLASGGELKLSLVDTELNIKMNADSDFQADGTIRLLNVGNKSIASINGHVKYWSATEQIFVVGTMNVAGIFSANARVDIRENFIKAEAQASIKIPKWMGWFVDCEMAEGNFLLTHSDSATVITVYGVLTDDKNYSSYIGIVCNLSTGEKFRIDREEDVDAAIEYNIGNLTRGNIAVEEYSVEGGSCLIFQGDYSNSSEDLQVCITNVTTGAQYNFSLSTDKVEQNTYSPTKEYTSIAPEVLVLNEKGFAIAIKSEEDATWQLCVQDNGRDLEEFDMRLVREKERNCNIDKFFVSDVTNTSAEICYSISGFDDDTLVELYCRKICDADTPDIWLANLLPGTNQTFVWEQTQTMAAGNYEFFLKVSGNMIPFESDVAGVFTVDEGENNFISAKNKINDNGYSAEIHPIFSVKYERKEYSFDKEEWFQITDETLLTVDEQTSIFLRGYDESTEEYSDVFTYKVNCDVSWNEQVEFGWMSDITEATYRIELSRENSSGSIFVKTDKNSLSFLGIMPEQLTGRVQISNSGIWTETKSISNSMSNQEEISTLISDEDGDLDLFFARSLCEWGNNYAAQHLGVLDGWEGTGEQVALDGKNQLADIFEGSSDANVLVMTDDANGDALFVDDIYTALPGTVDEQQARIAQIDEIRAGLGDDIVDMTSQRFAYVGDGVKIYGGLGNDTIWANNGSNSLFGDAGNDRIIGGTDNDEIIGGSGNDAMHGGGGNDVFCFGENWGKDTVEQLAGGEITLWFESGSEDNWNADTLTYTDGTNSVKVSGVSNDNITLIFGDDGSLRYDELASAGYFDDAASEKIFEDKNKGMLA